MTLLESPTMVLNKGWHSIDIKPVWKALGTVMSERAYFLLTPDYSQHDMRSWTELPVEDGEPFIQWSQGRIKIPKFTLLRDYDKIPKRKVVFCRRNIWRRDHKRCQYCGEEPANDDVTIDHIVPKSKGGLSIFENCVLSCTACNLKKANRTLQQAGMKLRRTKRLSSGQWHTVYYITPKRPIWNPLYALKRKSFPSDWAPFIRRFDESLYWEVALEKE